MVLPGDNVLLPGARYPSARFIGVTASVAWSKVQFLEQLPRTVPTKLPSQLRGEMTTSEPELAVRYEGGAGGSGGLSGTDSGAFHGEPAPAVFALPFQGWLALADAVADTAPDTADLMTAAAYLAQSALEERLPGLVHQLSDVLTGSGFSSGAVEGVCSALLANQLAFTPEAVTDELASLYSDLDDDHPLRRGDGPLQMADAAIEAFLDSDLAGPDAHTVYDDTAARVKQCVQPHWWASCSLDLPSVLAQPPIRCARPGFRVSDQLIAREWTYRGRVLTGFKGSVKGRGPVGTVTAKGGYRDSIDSVKPQYYWDTLNTPSSGLAFGLSLSEGRAWPWADKVSRALNGRRTNIVAKIGQEVRGAQTRIGDLLTAAQVPAYFLHPVMGLMVTAARVVAELISGFLVKSLGDKNLTNWAIWHTAVMGQDRVPISVFTLSLPGENTPELHYVRSSQAPSGGFTASDDYGADPGFLDHARFMIGASELPATEFDNVFFDLTERTGKPLTWRDPLKPNGGFRILVPHRARGTKASYVSALRVDVRLEERPKVFQL